MRPFSIIALVLLASAAQAAPSEGAKIAAEGTPDGAVPPCESCHQTGEGPFPLLAGQEREYLSRQLDGFRTDKRPSEMMAPIAKALTPKQIQAVAAHYAAERPRRATAGKADAKQVDRGRAIATGGLPAHNVLACQRCHGEDAILNFANLDGQNPDYILEQLQAFRENRRVPLDPMMNGVARNLGDDDAKAVAAYYLEQVKGK